MNDWSRLAVDLNEKQKLGAEKSNCTHYKYALERRTGPRPLRKRELTNPNCREVGARDNSVSPFRDAGEDNSVPLDKYLS